jgi:hypothetical protein
MKLTNGTISKIRKMVIRVAQFSFTLIVLHHKPSAIPFCAFVARM